MANITLELNRYKISADIVYYLGHVILAGLLKLAVHTTDVVAKLKYPMIQTEPRYFLSMCNVFRLFF